MGNPDPAILKARALFERSEMSLDALGRALGLDGETARKAAWQLLNRVNDPKIGTLRALARALHVSIEELVGEERKRQR
jgi:transcriptional regulator with XRE-family HTH domain